MSSIFKSEIGKICFILVTLKLPHIKFYPELTYSKNLLTIKRTYIMLVLL